MKDIEKAAAKLRSLKVENKAARIRSAESRRQIRQEARYMIDRIDLSADAETDRAGQHSVAMSFDKQEDLSDASLHNSTLNGEYESESIQTIDKEFNFQQTKIPLRALRESGHITPGVVKNRLTEEYRRIKRPLIRNLDSIDLQADLNLLMVTSAVAGEGKTYTSINLAMSLAQEKGRQVIFVDADVLKGSAGLKLGASRESPGLIDVLSGAVPDVKEVIQRTNVSNLWFVSAGNSDSHANELLASDGMEQCIRDITNLFEDCILVFDCPPILLTNEANVLLFHAGQIVFVVAERVSSQKHVKSALAQIDDSKYVGIVLNKSRKRRADYSNGYGYGYGG